MTLVLGVVAWALSLPLQWAGATVGALSFWVLRACRMGWDGSKRADENSGRHL